MSRNDPRGAPRRAVPAHAAVGVLVSFALATPQRASAGPSPACEAAENAYTAILDPALSDDERIELALNGLTVARECPVRRDLVIVLLNLVELSVSAGEAEGRLCDALSEVDFYQESLTARGDTRDPAIAVRLEQLRQQPAVIEACAEKSAPPRETRLIKRPGVRAGIGLAAVGAAWFAVAGGFSGLVLRAENEREQWYGGMPCVIEAKCMSLAVRGERLELTQEILFGIAGTLVAAGIIALGVGVGVHRKHERREKPTVRVVGPSLIWHF